MGLFSFFSKNKQGRTAEDSGRFYSKDDDAAIGERARAKRASNAGATPGTGTRRSAADPMLPEKKRARRRLVGAIAIALAAAVGLPMLLDSEPKPLAGDIAIQIPSKDKAPPLAVPGATPAGSGTPAAAHDKAVAAADSVDQDEEIVDAPPVAMPKPVERKPDVVKPKPKADPKPDVVKSDAVKADAIKPEHKEPKPEHKDAKPDHKDAKPEHKDSKADKPKPEEKTRPAPSTAQADARALAILEGKTAARDKPVEKEKPSVSSSDRFVLQVAAMSSQDKAEDLQARLSGAGISSYTQKFGDLIRVKVGPLSKEDADRVRAKLGRMGLSPSTIPL